MATRRKNKPRGLEEYLRRNLLACKAVGAAAYTENAIDRLSRRKRPPVWLLRVLVQIHERVAPLGEELWAHRDELKKWALLVRHHHAAELR